MRPGPGTDERIIGGRYTIHDLLGSGGMGRVWRADDQLLRRPVAVKEIEVIDELPDSAQPATRDRVLREARAAARSSHPHSVGVFDVVEEDDRVYIVMELVDAPSLDKVVRARGPLPPHEAAAVGLHVLDALTAAHRSGVVHRDVKPGNVLVTERDGAKLGDFGIAAVKEDVTRTMTGLVRGSPAYLAPEQARGEPTGPATDLWALGATLYYAVEGVPPWDRDGAIPTLTAIVTEEPRPMTRAGALAPIISRLLGKDPAQRPAADELRRTLVSIADGTAVSDVAATAATQALTTTQVAPPVAAPLPSPAPAPAAAPARRPPPPRRSSSSAFGWVIVVLILALVGGLVAFGLTQSDDDPAGEATGDTTTTAPVEEPPAEAPVDETTTTTEATTTTTAAPETDDLPEGWTAYTDPVTGYTIGHPADWDVVPVDDSATDFRSPDGSYLRVDWVQPPGDDPVAAWEANEEDFAASHDDYERIRIEESEFQGHDGAIWEFTYEDGGAELHALNLGFVTADRGYALFFQTQDDEWDESQDTFEVFQETFELAE